MHVSVCTQTSLSNGVSVSVIGIMGVMYPKHDDERLERSVSFHDEQTRQFVSRVSRYPFHVSLPTYYPINA